jgi:acetyl esterase/lipase
VSGIFETQRSTPKKRRSVSRLIAAGALALLTGGIIAGCAATAPAAPTAITATAVAATVAPAAIVVPTATVAAAPAAPAAAAAPQGAPQGAPPRPPPGGAGAPPKVITPTLTNIAYATASGTQVLDLYLPEGNGPFPVVVNIHPGGFFSGDKEMVPGNPGKAMLKAGYAIASINYRLSGEATFPAAVQDAKAAVRFLRANAAKYKLNPDKIAAFGQSAGGNLASLLGTSGDMAEFDDPKLGNAGVSSRVQAVINWFGPNDFSVMDAQAKAQGCPASDQTHSAADSPESKYLGAPVPSSPELAKKANPMTYITKDDPPFFVQKGDQDCTIAIENTKMLADALAAAGMDVHYDLLKGVGHGDGFGATTPVFESESNSQALVDFLNAKLKGQTAAPAATAAAAPTATPATAAAAAPAAPAGRGAPGGVGGGMPAIKATPTFKEVAYASASPTQKLDIYLPAGNGPFPLIINVHGGGFMMGDKSNPPGADEFLANGYAVASVDYRLSGEARAPAQIQDIKAAVRFLRANASKYKLNPDKFAASGGSAGGSLVALLGTSCGVAALEGAELGNTDQSSCVQAVVDQFGPTDFLQIDKQFAGTACPVNHDAANSPESMLVGAPIQTVPDKVKLVNPITYASAKAPPFLIQHGTADCNVPPQQSQLLYDALKAAIGADKVTVTFLQGAGHGDPQFTAPANMKVVLDFLAKYLKG